MPKYITIGRVGAPYGLKGWSKLQSFTDPQTTICRYLEGWLQLPHQTSWQPYKATIKPLSKILLIKFPDDETPEEARKLTGAMIAIQREMLPNLKKDDYYWSDLEGITLITETGIDLGQLAYFIPTGANDVMLVKNKLDKKERLIPYIEDVVITIDLERQEMRVNWDPEF